MIGGARSLQGASARFYITETDAAPLNPGVTVQKEGSNQANIETALLDEAFLGPRVCFETISATIIEISA